MSNTDSINPITGLPYNDNGKSKIKENQIINPLTGSAVDEVKKDPRVDILGSSPMDIEGFNLGKEDISDFQKYGVNLLRGEDYMENRAQSQGTMNKLGSGLVRLPLTAATKLGSSLFFTGSLLLNMFDPNNWGEGTEGAIINAAANNSLSAMFNNLEEDVKQHLAPIYETNAYKNGDWLEQMGTVEFWASDVVDGLAFGISSLAETAMLTGPLRGISGMAAGKTAAAAKALRMQNIASDVKKLSNIYGRVGSTALISTGEAMFEAKDVRDQLIAKGVPPEEAAKRARDTFALNMLILGPSNFIETGFLMKTLGRQEAGAASRIGYKAGKAYDTTSELGGFAKFMDSTPARVGKVWGVSAASEGLWEENAQLAIQTLAQEYGEGKRSGNILDIMSDMPGQMYENLKTNEGKKSVVLGALIGGIMGTAGGLRERSAEQATRDTYIKAINDGNKAWNEKESIYKKEIKKVKAEEGAGVVYEAGTPEAAENYGEITFPDGEKKVYKNKDDYDTDLKEGKTEVHVVLDEKGNAVIDEAKYASLLANKQMASDLDYLRESAYENGEYLLYRLYTGEKFTKRVKSFHNADMFDLLIEELEGNKELSQEELEARNYNTSEKDEYGNTKSSTELMDEYIKDAKELKKAFDAIEKGVIPQGLGMTKLPGYDVAFDIDTIAEMRKQELYDIAAREYYVNKELEKVRANIESINLTGEESVIASKDRELQAEITKNNELLINAENKDDHETANTLRETAKKLANEYEAFKNEHAEELKKVVKDKTGRERLLSAVAKNKLTVEEIKAAELSLTKRELNTLFENIAHPSKGKKYFVDNWLKIKTNKTAGQVLKLPSSKLLETGPVAYFNYEDSKIKSYRISSTIQDGIRENFSSALIERLITGSEDINDILDDIIKVEPILTARAWRQLKEAVGKTVVELSKKRQAMENEIEWEIESTQEALEKTRNKKTRQQLEERIIELTNSIDALVTSPEYIAMQEQEDLLDDKLDQIDDLNLVGKTIASTSDTDLRKRVAKEFYEPLVTEVTQNFTLNDDYQETDDIENTLRVLRKLYDIYGTDQENFPYRADIQSLITTQITEMEKIQKEIYQRKENRAKKQGEIWDNYTTKLWGTIGIMFDEDGNVQLNPTFNPILDSIRTLVPNFQEILEKAAEDNYNPIYVDMIMQAVRDNGKVNGDALKVLVKNVKDVIKGYKELLLNDKNVSGLSLLKAKLADDRDIEIHSAHIDLYKKAPIRGFMDFVAKFKYDYDRTKQSSIYKYLKDADIIELEKNLAIEVSKGIEGRAEFLEFVQFHKLYSGLYDILDEIKSVNYDVEVQIGMELNSLEADKSTPAPTAQQVIAIRDIAKYAKRAVKDTAFSGWAYLRGYAGTGKTTITLKWASKFLGIKNPKTEIFGVGHTESSTNTLIKSINSDPTATLDKLKEGKIDENIKLIVIDEVGAITNDDLASIGELVRKLNETRKNKLKVITLGDPNQMTFEPGTASAAIDRALFLKGSEIITNIQPLTIRYRSNVGAVVSFQDKFLDQQENLLTGQKLATRSNTITLTKEGSTFVPRGVLGTDNFTPESIVTILKSRAGSKTSKAVIVNNKVVNEYKKAIENAGITDVEVLSVYQSQGRTIDEVYVNLKFDNDYEDIEHYNKGLYTATSRAANFIYIGHVPVATELDTDIESNSTSLDEEVVNRREEYKAELESAAKILSELRTEAPKSEETEKEEEEVETETKPKTEEEKEIEETEVEEGSDYDWGTYGRYSIVKGRAAKWFDIVDENNLFIERDLDIVEAMKKAQELAEQDLAEEGKVKEEDLSEEDIKLGPTITSDFEETEEERENYEAINHTNDLEDNTYYDANKPFEEKGPVKEVALVEGDYNHVLAFPTNAVLHPVKDENGEIIESGLEVGDEVDYVLGFHKDEFGIETPSIYLLKKLGGLEGIYREVGIVGTEELSTLPEYMQNKVAEAIASNRIARLDRNDKDKTITSEYDVIPLFTGTIKVQPHKLEYQYNESPTLLTKQKYEKIISHFKEAFLGKATTTNRKGDIKIRIFKGKEATNINKAWNISLEPGVPYIYFKHPKKDNSNKDLVKPQFIRLNPRKMSNTVHKEMLVDIFNFMDTGKELNDILASGGFRLGNIYFNQIIKDIAKGKLDAANAVLTKVKIEAPTKDLEKFNPELFNNLDVQRLARKLYELAYTEDNDREASKWRPKDLVQRIDETNPFTDKDGKPKYEKVKEVVKTPEGWAVRLYKDPKVLVSAADLKLVNDATPGPAQQAFNKIAKANLVADGTLIREFRKLQGKPSFTTGRLLLPTRNTTFKTSNEVHMSYVTRVADREGLTIEQAINKIINSEDRFRLVSNLSIEKLDKIFDFDAKGNTTSGLRVPIPLTSSDLNLTDKNYEGKVPPIPSRTAALNATTYSKYFETTFSDIVPTTITVTVPIPVEVEEKETVVLEATEDVEESEEIALDENGIPLEDPNKMDDDDIVLNKERGSGSIGKKISRAKAIKLLKKLLPNATDDQLKIVTVARLMQINGGRAAWATWKNGIISIAEDGVTKPILRHEIVHEVINRYLTSEEKAELFKEATAQYGKLSEYALEEKIADDFMYYDSFFSKLKRLFRKIAEFFKFISKNRNKIEEFFDKLDSGAFTYINNPTGDFESKNKVQIQEDYGDIETYITAKEWFVDKLWKQISPIIYKKAKSTSKKQLTRFIKRDRRIDPRLLAETLPKTKSESFRYIYAELITRVTKLRKALPGLEVEVEKAKEDKSNYNKNGSPKKELLIKENQLANYKLELNGLSKLLVGENFTNMVLNFYPSIKLKKGQNILDTTIIEKVIGGEMVESISAEEANEINEGTTDAGSLYETHIQDSDLKDPKKNLSQRAKDFASFIMYPTTQVDPITNESVEKMVRIPYKQAYAIMLEKLQGLDFSNFSVARKQLSHAFGSNPDPKNKAILERLRHLLDTVDKSKTITDAETLALIKAEHEGKAYMPALVNIPSKEQGYFQDEDTFIAAGEIIKRENKSTVDFYKDIYDKTSIKDYNTLVTLYNKMYYRITLVEMVTATVSMIKKNVKLGLTVKNKDGGFEHRYIRQNEYGYRELIRSHVIKSFESSFLNNYSSLKGNIKAADVKDEGLRSARVRSILQEMNLLPNADSIITPADAATFIKDVEGMLDLWKTHKSMDKVVEDSSDRIGRITSLIVSNTDLQTVTNYTRGDGKRAWMHMEGNQALESIKVLMNGWRTRPAFFDAHFFTMNPFLRKEDPNNPNSKEAIPIYSYVHHDSQKDENNGSVVLFTNESTTQWLGRNLLTQFIGSMSSSAEGNLRYVQPFWTNSNKPNNEGVEIPVLSNDTILENIMIGLKQEALRLPIKHIVNYQNNKNLSSFIGRKKVMTASDANNDTLLKAEAEKVMKELEAYTDKVLDFIEVNNFRFSSSQLSKIYNSYPSLFREELREAIKKEFGNKLDYAKKGKARKVETTEEVKTETTVETDTTQDIIFNKDTENKPTIGDFREILRPIVELHVKNHYINSHFINQITQGDTAFFKSKVNKKGKARKVNEFDIIKRISIAFAQGKRGMVHNEYGMKETFNVAVGKDIRKYIDVKDFKRFKGIMGKNYDAHDGQGFMTMARYLDIQKGFGPAAGIAPVMKPVHYEIDGKGIPAAMKYSSIVLTEGLMEMFPGLRTLNDEMMRAGTDEFIFGSGFKVGAPITTVDYNTDELHVDIKPENIRTLSNKYWRIQQQPYHDAKDQRTAHPTQLTYFANSSGLSFEEALTIYNSIADIHKTGLKSADLKFNFESKSNRAARTLRNEIISNLKDNKGSKDNMLEYLSAKDDNGNPVTSLNAPFLIKQVVVEMANMLSKKTVEIKYAGGKFVLQAAYGTDLRTDQIINKKTKKILKENKLDPPVWRTEENYAEVYLPDTYKDKVKEGDFVLPGEAKTKSQELYHKMLGFRIPSTELHSAIPLRVKGFYPTSAANENIIIAPHEIVFYHGSDYDVDALYIIRREEANISIPEVTTKGLFSGYTSKGEPDFDNVLVKIEEAIKAKRKERREKINAFDEAEILADKDLEKERRKEYSKEMNTNTSELQDLYELKIITLKNRILDTFLDIITADKNQESMRKPISMSRFNGSSEGKYEETVFDMLVRLRNKESIDDLYEDRDLNLVLDQAAMHMDNHAGNALTGVFANSAKSFFYIGTAARMTEDDKKAVPKLKENFHIHINGGVYDSLSLTEKIVKDGELVDNLVQVGVDPEGEPEMSVPLVSEVIDMLINAAIDNVKEQILSIINATDKTKAALIGFLSVGVPLHTVTKIMLQPALMYASAQKLTVFKVYQEIEKVLMDNGYSAEELEEMTDAIDITDEALEKNISTYTTAKADLEKMKKEDILFQYAVLKQAHRADKLGNSFAEVSTYLGILQQLPIYFYAVQDSFKTIDSFYEARNEKGGDYIKKDGKRVLAESFPFTNVDLLTVPHIKSAFDINKALKKRIQSTILAHSQELVKFTDTLKDTTSINLKENVGIHDRYANEESELFRIEYIKYLLNGLKFKVGEIAVEMDNSTVKPYTFEYGEVSKVLEGDEAWIEEFIDKVEAAYKDDINNKFLNAVQIKRGFPSKTRYLRFLNLGTQEEEDILALRADFVKLAEKEGGAQLQADFIKYAVLTQGLAFNSTNYSMVIPPIMYKEIFRALDNKFRMIYTPSSKETEEQSKARAQKHLKNIGTHFTVQLMLNNLDKKPDFKGEVDGKGQIDGKFFYDLSIKREEGKIYEDYIKKFDTLYYKVKSTTTKAIKNEETGLEEEDQGMVYYVKIGKQKEGNFYNYSAITERQGYDIAKAFDPSVSARSFIDPNTLKRYMYNEETEEFDIVEGVDENGKILNFEETTSTILEVGSVLRAIKKGDDLRANYIDYRVIKKYEKGDKTFYKLERIFENPETESKLADADNIMKLSKKQEEEQEQCNEGVE